MNRFLGISTSGFKSRLVPSRCPWKRKCERPLATIRSERRTKNWKTRVNTFLLRKCGKVLINRFSYNVTVNDLINAQESILCYRNPSAGVGGGGGGGVVYVGGVLV